MSILNRFVSYLTAYAAGITIISFGASMVLVDPSTRENIILDSPLRFGTFDIALYVARWIIVSLAGMTVIFMAAINTFHWSRDLFFRVLGDTNLSRVVNLILFFIFLFMLFLLGTDLTTWFFVQLK